MTTSYDSMWQTNYHDGSKGTPITRCPCCGQTARFDKPLVDKNIISFRGQIARVNRKCSLIFAALIKAYPNEVPTSQCIFVMYNGEDEPDAADNNLHVYACLLRKQIKPLGLDIKATYYCGYRLVIL